MDAYAGPPFVKFIDSSNNCNVPFVDMIAVNKIVGFNSGTVILKNVCIGDAPSILAASYTEYSVIPKGKIPYYTLSISRAVL